MIRFRILGLKDLQQAIALLEQFEAANPQEDPTKNYSSITTMLSRLKSLQVPFYQVSHWLPLALKYLPEIYVASENDTVLSLVWMSQDGSRKDCWRIEEIIINPDSENALNVSKQLIQHALGQLSNKGVETFLAYIHKHAANAVGLLKECGFRYCTSISKFQFVPPDDWKRPETLPKIGLRESHNWDAKYIAALYTDSLPPEIRVSLRKNAEELYPNISQNFIRQCKGQFYKSWVLPHRSQEYCQAFLSIQSPNYRDFKISLIYSIAVDDDLDDLITFALYQCFLNGSRITVNIDVYGYQKKLTEYLESQAFEKLSEQDILVKDHWIPLQDKEKSLIKNPLLLFGEEGKTSPA